MQSGSFNLVAKYVVLFSWLGILLTSVYVFMFYGTFAANAFQTVQDEARANAAAIAETVDFTGHELIQTEEHVALPEYQRMFDDLNLAAHVHPNLTFVYTMRKTTEGEWVFVIDADIPEDENENGVIDPDEASALPGEVYDFSCCPWIDAALIGPIADEEVTTDVWGTWISGYAPIFNDEGVAIGIVGVDIAADAYLENIGDLRDLILRTLGLTVLLTLTFGIFGLMLVRADARRIQHALEIRNEELDALVKKRTSSLEMMMSTMVHELRAPLTAIKWSVPSIPEEKKNSKAQKELVSDIGLQTEQMLSLVGDLLNFSRIELGKLKINKKKNDLSKIVSATVRMYKSNAESKGLALHLSIEKGIPQFVFDKDKIVEVLNNLISNAIKYTEKGDIHISVLKVDDDVRIEVADTGIGISDELKERLFNPFERHEGSSEVGTGLGLYITKGIVEAHGGTIGVASRMSKGSTFWFELPLK